MTDLKFTREQIIEMVKDGFLNKRSIFHYDVCRALAEKKSADVEDDYEIGDSSGIRYMKKHKCKYCR
jgi:hypothetical protein